MSTSVPPPFPPSDPQPPGPRQPNPQQANPQPFNPAPSNPVPGDPFASQAPLPPGKKPNILLWVLGGFVALMLGFTAMCGLGGYFLMRKAKQAGFDSGLLTTNPAYAAAKMAATMNPETDTISSDDSTGTITVREKKTGKTMTLKFDPQRKTMVVTDENGKQATVSVNTEKGAVEVQSSEGNMKFGTAAGNQMPGWIPVYPGSSPSGTFSSQSKDGGQSTFAFKTTDAPAKVMSYYQDQLKSGGFSINMSTNTPQGGIVMAEDAAKTHSLMLTVSGSGEGSDVSLTAIEKK